MSNERIRQELVPEKVLRIKFSLSHLQNTLKTRVGCLIYLLAGRLFNDAALTTEE
jgi:hypothetical protein